MREVFLALRRVVTASLRPAKRVERRRSPRLPKPPRPHSFWFPFAA